jgi:hypothetical protein
VVFILPVRFTGLSGQTETEPNWQDFMVLKSVFYLGSVFSVNFLLIFLIFLVNRFF